MKKDFKNNKVKNQETLGGTENYETPKYLVQPAEHDKGFELVSKEFKKENIFTYVPKISF